MAKEYILQGVNKNQLFQAGYDHKGDDDCEECDPSMIMERPIRENVCQRCITAISPPGNKS